MVNQTRQIVALEIKWLYVFREHTKTLPSHWASLLYATNAFQVTWSEQVSQLFVLDMSLKCIDREGLGRRCTGTRQEKAHDKEVFLPMALTRPSSTSSSIAFQVSHGS